MIFVFYFFALILVFLGYKSLRGGIDYLNYFKKELVKTEPDFTPYVSVIVPCRGVDEGFRRNLSALFEQNYPKYEIIFVFDDEKDQAFRAVEDLVESNTDKFRADETGNSPGKIIDVLNGSNVPLSQRADIEKLVTVKYVIAGRAEDEGQKVRNLRQAVLETAAHSEIFVFVDSDARPTANWMRDLIAPLEDETVGAATGYRWFISKSGGFSSQLRSVWNASIASALGANGKSNFCWGGATAIRRATFEKLNIREKWRGTLSDDFTVTRVLKEASLPICFVPQALTATVEDCSFSELLEFTTRQMKITRVYAPHLWKASFAGSFLFSFTFWTGVLLLFFVSGWQFQLTLAFLLVIFALGAGKAYLRLNAVKLVLESYEKELNKSFLWQMTLWTITPILFFYNDFASLLSRKIIWRGIEYELKSAGETVIISENVEYNHLTC